MKPGRSASFQRGDTCTSGPTGLSRMEEAAECMLVLI